MLCRCLTGTGSGTTGRTSRRSCVSFAGGIRASIWTDVAQSIVMLIAMSVLVVICHFAVVPITGIFESLNNIDPKLVAWTPSDASLGLFPYAMGWFFAGFGGVGQPHIIVRAMTVSHPDQMPKMRRTYFSWYVLFSIATFLVGLYSRIYFDSNTSLYICVWLLNALDNDIDVTYIYK